MRRKPDIDIPVIRGEHRQIERNDKPPHVPNLMYNMQQKQEGVWERRPGTELLHPDRGTQFQFTSPLTNRGIDDYDSSAFNAHDYLYNCHKRKVVALGETDAAGVKTQYVFMGVILDYYRSAEYQELKIYRGIVSRKSDGTVAYDDDPLDGVTIAWDSVPTYNALAKVDHQRSSTCFIEYSMKMNAAMNKLYIVIGLRDDDDNPNSIVRVVELTNLYNDAWDHDGTYPTWTQTGATILSQHSLNNYLSRDIDIEIDESGDLHIIYGYRDTVDGYYFKYYNYISGIYTNVGDINPEGDGDVHGVAMKLNTTDSCLYFGFFFLDSVNEVYRIMKLKLVIAGGVPSYGEADIVENNAYYVADNKYDCGPVVAVDTGGEVYYAYKTSKTQIAFSPGALVSVPNFGVYGGDTNYDILTNWDMVVKDGVIHFYYVHVVRHSDDNPHRFSPKDYFEIRRATYVIDTTDADYDADSIFDWENKLVETHLDLHTYLCCYNTFESDSPKRFTFIRYDYAGNGVVTIPPEPLYHGKKATSSHQFNYIRQDRGIRWGVVELGIRVPHRFLSRDTDGIDTITVIQCLTPDGLVRWYERGAWQWDLLQGQADRDNDGIIQETEITGRASMWSNNGVLRSGCGIELGNIPVWDALLDRNYFNNTVDLQIRRRHFQLDRIFPPNIASSFENGSIVIIGEKTDSPIWQKAVGVSNWIGSMNINNPDFAKYEAFVRNTINCPIWYNLDEETVQNWQDQQDSGNVIWDMLQEISRTKSDTLAGEGISLKRRTVTHPYLKFRDLGDGNVDFEKVYAAAGVAAGWNNTVDGDVALPYMEVFVGFAYRYDNGEMSQITPQAETNPFKLGMDIDVEQDTDNVLKGTTYAMLRCLFRLRRHDFTGDPVEAPRIPAIDPRITSIVVFIGEKTSIDATKYDVVYRKWKEIYVAKPHETPFLDEPENGDSVWNELDDGIMTIDVILDFRQYQLNSALENMVDYIGVGNALSRSAPDESSLTKHYLDGYKHAAIIEERPHYFGIRLNGKKWEDHAIWAADAVQGGERFVVPDVVDPAFRKIFPFKLINGKGVGNDNIVYVGDRDLVLARVLGDPLEWQFIKTIQDVGGQAEWAVTVIAEAAESGNLDGVFFLGLKTGGRVFDLYKAVPSTNDVNNDYIAGSNPSSTRIEATHKGVVSLADDDAMAIHLPEYRLFLLHFPTDGITKVRDFRAEDHARQGYEWLTWEFAHNPTAWCVAPEGYLIYTDGDQLLRFPKATDDGKDVTTAIQIGGRIDIGTPDKMDAEFQEIGLKYKCVGTTLTVTIVRDDGVRSNMMAVFPERAVKGEDHIRVGWQKKINEEISIEWELTVPGECTAFELHKIFGYIEGQRVK